MVCGSGCGVVWSSSGLVAFVIGGWVSTPVVVGSGASAPLPSLSGGVITFEVLSP